MSRIVVLVGTDHHPFTRAVEWADAWAGSHPGDDVLIQHGRTSAPARARGVDFMSPAQLRAEAAAADVVITHGGPGTISDARGSGHRPIVFPRDPVQGEHVDDHQQRFAAWIARRGLVDLARTSAELDARVDALGEVGTRTDAEADTAASAAVALVGHLIEAPLGSRPVVPGAPVVIHLAGDAARVAATERELASRPGALVLGPLDRIWADGVVRNGRCRGCGRPFSDCPLWQGLGEHAFGGWRRSGLETHPDPGDPRSVRAEIRRRSRVLRRHPGRVAREELLAAAAPYRALLDAARALTGAGAVVDASRVETVVALSHDHAIDVRALRLSTVGGRIVLEHRSVPTVTVDLVAAGSLPAAVTAALTGLGLSLDGAAGGIDHPRLARIGT